MDVDFIFLFVIRYFLHGAVCPHHSQRLYSVVKGTDELGLSLWTPTALLYTLGRSLNLPVPQFLIFGIIKCMNMNGVPSWLIILMTLLTSLASSPLLLPPEPRVPSGPSTQAWAWDTQVWVLWDADRLPFLDAEAAHKDHFTIIMPISVKFIHDAIWFWDSFHWLICDHWFNLFTSNCSGLVF